MAARGFTLIELVMTLVVVGILAVFATSRLDFASIFQQRGVYDKLKAGLEYARKTAVAKRRCVQATFGGNSVSFLYDSNTPEVSTLAGVSCANSNFAAANYVTLPAPDKDCVGPGNAVCSHSAGVISAGTSFTFDAQGAASTATTFTVSGMPTITVEATTGYVH